MSSTAGALALVITLILVIALYVFVLPDAKRPTLNSFLRKVHDFLKIKKLLTEAIFRFFYVFSVVACVIGGVFKLFDEFLVGIGLIIFGPIASRIVFEMLLMGVVLVKNVMDINNHLRGIDTPQDEKDTNISVEDVISNVSQKIQDIAAAKETTKSEKVCPNCGKAIPDGTSFCIHCGSKIEE